MDFNGDTVDIYMGVSEDTGKIDFMIIFPSKTIFFKKLKLHSKNCSHYLVLRLAIPQ